MCRFEDRCFFDFIFIFGGLVACHAFYQVRNFNFFPVLVGVRVGVSHPAVSAGGEEACSHFCDAVAGM